MAFSNVKSSYLKLIEQSYTILSNINMGDFVVLFLGQFKKGVNLNT